MSSSLGGSRLGGRSSEMFLEECEHFLPGIDGLLGPIGGPAPVEERMPGAVVAVELVGLAEALERLLGPIHVVDRRILVAVPKDTKQRTAKLLSKLNRRNRPLGRDVGWIVNNPATTPAI